MNTTDFKQAFEIGIRIAEKFANSSEDELMQIPDSEFDSAKIILAWLDDNKEKARALQVLDATKASAGDDIETITLRLFHDVARHLTGGPVELLIQEPESPGALGECWLDEGDPAVKVAISPSVYANLNSFLDIFLHEVAHARLHVDHARPWANAGMKAEKFNGQFEKEAQVLARRWKTFAWSNRNGWVIKGMPNRMVLELHQQLHALLNNPGVAKWMVSLDPANPTHV